jgi:sugar-phosphatase
MKLHLRMLKLNTVIFDMDGLLIDSEPLWDEAANDVFRYYDVQIKPAQYLHTVGMRTREFLDYWFSYFKLDKKYLPEAEKRIIEKVIIKVAERGKVMPGAHYILDYFKKRNFKIGLATSSPLSLVDVVIQKMDAASYFDTYASAESLPYGKPHPMVYLNCLEQLNADPLQALCFEDSFNGMIAAKSAKMKCVVVPAAHALHDNRWHAADLKLSSLQNFNDLLLDSLSR